VNRTTLQSDVHLSGVGLFTAQACSLTISPNHDETGIVFRHQSTDIPATIANLSTIPVHPIFAEMKPRCTGIGDDEISIATIEHLLSALAGIGITDAIIAIESQHPHCEIPIFDGSAIRFAKELTAVGTRTLDSTIEPITLRKPIEIKDHDASITIEPADSPSYSYTLDYTQNNHNQPPPIPSSTVTWSGNHGDYVHRIALARTFCLEHEADAMHSAGLFTHLSTKDMLVIGDHGPIDNAYRIKDECARHKLLDLIGDLSLVGRPLCAKVSAIRSGHALTHQAARAIVEQFQSPS